MNGKRSRVLCVLAWALVSLSWPAREGICGQTEMGFEGDVIVIANDGTALDPNLKVKGFSVFGATQTAYTGASAAPGNVVVNGVLAVSSGAYFVGDSTFPAAGKIFINDGSPGQILSKDAAGYLQWTNALGDNLGNHTATTQLKMGNYAVWSSSDITAARYQINGSTVLALPGGSLAVGRFAGFRTTGGASVFVGDVAGYSNTTGIRNVFLGNYAADSNTTGSQNVAIGYSAADTNATGSYNVFIGDYAGGMNATGERNVFIGNTVAGSNASGTDNVVLGYYAGNYTQTGSANTILGGEAAYGGAPYSSFSSSTLMGYRAGYSLTTGGDNIFLGWQAGYPTTTGARNIVIGYDQRTSAAAAGNELNIGGVLFGKLDARTIGISTRVPQAALDIVSTGTTAGEMAQIWRGSDGVVKASMSATGVMMAVKFVGDGSGLTGIIAGDNLGNHLATADLKMSSYSILNVASMTIIGDGIRIATSVYAGASGVFVSTSGQLITLGLGNGTAQPAARGIGAVDLQTYRANASSVAAGAYSVLSGGMDNRAGAPVSVVAGGGNNTVLDGADYAVISGGSENRTGSWDFATIGGGRKNSALQYGDTIAGGTDNVAKGSGGFIGGGDRNVLAGMDSVAAGGAFNYVYGSYSAVGGGNANIVTGNYSVAGGGDTNTVNGWGAVVPGGFLNTAKGDSSFAAGYASSSTANGSFTWADSQGVINENSVADRVLFKNRGGFLITGSTNTNMSGMLDRGMLISGNGLVGISTGTPYAALDVVSSATAVNVYAQIWRNGGGVIVASMTSQGTLYAALPSGTGDNLGNHTATTDLNMAVHSVVGVASVTMVGKGLQIGTDLTSAASGVFVSTSGQLITLGLGNGTALPAARGHGAVDLQTYRTNSSSVAAGAYSVVAGGGDNRAAQDYAVAAGGLENTANGWAATVAGGWQNTALNEAATVAGGEQNAAGQMAAVSGGWNNRATGYASVIGGGYDNSAPAQYTAIGGGYQNYANNTAATVAGGWGNSARDNNAAVGGGYENMAGGASSVISGGMANRASGSYSAVPGGQQNSASGSSSFAAGWRSSSTANGSFTWSDFNGSAYNYNSVANRTAFKNVGGFLVTGSTNPAMTGLLDRGLLVTGDGLVGISTGAPYAALDVVSTGTTAGEMAQIWRASDGVVKASMSATGVMMAAKFIGDGTGLTGLPGDNLGNHTATTQLKMGGYAVWSSSDITAARYQINGSTVLAILPAIDSLAIGVNAGRISSGNRNLFVGNNAGYATAGAYGNAFVGTNAGSSTVSGNDNTFVGVDAGLGNTDGFYNAFFGNSAAFRNTSGWANSAFGTYVLESNTLGDNNTVMGYLAANDNTTGSGNTILGSNAGYSNRTGSANVIIGMEAGYGISANSFSNSTLVGYQAGYALRNASADNIFVGYKAGYNVTTGTGNIVIGYDKSVSAVSAKNELNIGGVLFGKLDAKTIGISTRVPQAALDIVSTGTTAGEMAQLWRKGDGVVVGSMSATGVMMAAKFIGDGSGLAGLPGDNLGNHTATQNLKMGGYGVNTSSHVSAVAYQVNGSTVLAFPGGSLAVGRFAGFRTTGGASVFVGNDAGYSNTTGIRNVFLGNYAADSNTTGSQNVAIGYNAADTNTTGSYNVFIGDYAGGMNDTGERNVFIGNTVASSNASGMDNAILGYYAANYTQAGSANAIFGSEAAYGGAPGASFSSSTVMGYRAGYSLTTGGDNTLLGWQAGYNVTSGTGNIIIGYDQRTHGAADSNRLNIGGVLFGRLDERTIGISTRTPQAALDIVSTATASNVYAQIWRGSDGVVKASMSATGVMMATKFIGDGAWLTNVPGDNLGNHTATADLNMAGFPVVNLSSVSMMGDGLHIATSVYAGASGLVVSTGGAIATTGAGYGSVAGNARGQGAVDLQTVRTAANQVAAPRYSSILGGTSNKIAETGPGWGAESVIAGGWSNAMSDGYRSFIGAGQENNIMPPGANFAVIGGGFQNRIDQSSGWSPWAAVVVGGGTNVASNYASFVGGGQSNKAIGYVSAIPGGEGNLAAGSYTGVFSGGYNTVTGEYSAIVGGEGNVVYSSHSFVAGSNLLLGSQANHTIAFGYQAYAFPGQYITAQNAFLIDPYHNGYKVGIGTPTPVALLHLSSGAATSGNMLVISTGSSDVIRMTGAGEIYAGKFYGTIPKSSVQAADTGIAATTADFGKTITVNSASAQTVTLPAVTAADIGATITIVKLGAGKVTIQAAASTYIADSSAAGTLYNSAVSPQYASVTLVLVASDRWMLVGGYGAWVTT